MHHLLRQLASVDAANPLSRKLLICPDLSYGRELLASLARAQGSWVGWEVTTLRVIAGKLAAIALAENRRLAGNDIVIAAACDIAIDEARGDLHPSLARLTDDPGTRAAIHSAIQELRLGGVDSRTIGNVSFPFAKSLETILQYFERSLETNRIADTAWILEQALGHFDREYPYTFGSARLFVVPSWSVLGLPAKLLGRLVERGASVLEPRYGELTTQLPATNVERFQSATATKVDNGAIAGLHGVSSPALPTEKQNTYRRIQFFHAATPAEELLAVMREALLRGVRFDDVEIACTNVDRYGVALEAICTRLGIPATMLDGVPLETTRVGRAIGRWLDWLDSGFNADVLRRALEAGDFTSAAHHGPALARLLRRANVGWGREATRLAAQRIAAFAVPGILSTEEDDDDPATIARQQLREQQLALAALLEELLAIAPPLRDATSIGDVPVECAAVARALSTMLDRIAVYDDAERATVEEVRARMDTVANNVQLTMSSAGAISFVRNVLAEMRAWTNVSDAARPRRAVGGSVHLTDLVHAGLTGRSQLFIVGLDADSVNGPTVQSSLLPDAVRARFPESLRTSEERRRIRAMQIDVAISASSAQLTLSFANSAETNGQRSAAHQFLEAWRREHARPAATYDDMRRALGDSRTAVPRPQDVPLDARDLWLQLLQDPANGALLRNADLLVRTYRPWIARGLDAIDIRAAATSSTPWHGLVPQAAAIDPRVTGAVVSPSSLEAFAACPLRWFYRHGLGIHAPRDLEFDEGHWLDAAMRGALLHDVYEQVIRARLHEQEPATSATRAVELLHDCARRWRRDIPPPSEPVYRAEVDLLATEVRLFLNDEHRQWREEPWELVASEMRFGDALHADIELFDRTRLPIRGRIDRVDRLPGGGLRIIDYKTGRALPASDSRGSAGGRKLQLAVYAAAVSQALGEPVVRAEYRYTTAIGDGRIIGAGDEQLEHATALVNGIVTEIAHGRFLPTFVRNDCTFCDYAGVCRTTPDRFGGTNSPRASWANNNKHLPEYEAMREWRSKP